MKRTVVVEFPDDHRFPEYFPVSNPFVCVGCPFSYFDPECDECDECVIAGDDNKCPFYDKPEEEVIKAKVGGYDAES